MTSERRGSDIRMLLNIRMKCVGLRDISVVTARALGLEERSAKLAGQRRKGEVEDSQWKRQRRVIIMVMTSSCHHQPSHILR